MEADLERAIDALGHYFSKESFSGTARVSSGASVLLEFAAGFANRGDEVPTAIDTRFGTASLTKSFTATAICQLVERGAATFETAVADVLPPARYPSAMQQHVTLHHLLTHTSGITDYYDEVRLGAAAFEEIWLRHPSYLFREPADFLPLFKDLPATREPGGREGSYCSAGFILLGLVVEELSGRRYADFIQTEIFDAAGMEDSGFFALDDVRERVATGYIGNPSGGWRTNHYAIPVVGGPDGGAFSTVRDLDRFLHALRSGVLVTENTWRLMTMRHAEMEGASYGYGLWIQQAGDRTSFGGAGADPGYSARAFYYPELDVTVTMLGNTLTETDAPMETFRSGLCIG